MFGPDPNLLRLLRRLSDAAMWCMLAWTPVDVLTHLTNLRYCMFSAGSTLLVFFGIRWLRKSQGEDW